MTRGQNTNGAWQRFEYDAAGRLVKIKDDSNNVLETYTYGASRNRLKNETSTQRTYYAWGGSSPIVEYTEATASSTPAYSKSYVYAGSRLVSTATKASSTTETTEYHHPDRLGTRLVTNQAASTNYQQSTLPFGTALAAESTGATNQLFTSYDRSTSTGLDYAVNRTYSQAQGSFTQIDPLNMAAGNITEPQSNNLYAYVQNMPADFVDPSGLLMAVFGGALWDCRTYCTGFGDGTPDSCETRCTFVMSIGGPGGPPTGQPPTNGDPGGGPSPSGDDPCGVTFHVFPMRQDEWTGMVRKKNTEYRHQFATQRTAELIREIGREWVGNGDPDIRVGDISLKNGVDTPDHEEHQKGDQLDIGLFVNGGLNIGGINYMSKNYDQATTLKLVDLLDKNPNVTKIIFNDPKAKGSKVVRDTTGVHDNHLHVEFDDGC